VDGDPLFFDFQLRYKKAENTMSGIQTIQKIAIVALIGVSLPILAMNVMMPRLAIATGDLNLEFADLTIVSFTSKSGYPSSGYNTSVVDNATLDFWLEIGLPVKNNGLGNDTHDLRYYNADGSVNTANLQDPTQEVVIPIIRVTAKYNDKVLGVGGSVRQYVLNKDHPIEYVHLYLTGSRMPDGGLMYLFNALTADGVLDQLITGAISGGGSFDLGSLLAGLSLDITAYLGGAPILLPLDASFFGLSPFPVVESSAEAILPTEFTMNPANMIIYYNYSHKVDTMDRLMAQLGLADIETALPGLFMGLGIDADSLTVMRNQLFDANPVPFNVTTVDEWWIAGNNISTNAMYRASEMEPFLSAEITAFKTDHDLFGELNMANVNANIGNTAVLRSILLAWANTTTKLNALNSEILQNQTSWYYRLHVLAKDQLPFNFPVDAYFDISTTTAQVVVNNTFRNEILTIDYYKGLTNLFAVMNVMGYGIGDFFRALDVDIPLLITTLLFAPLDMNNMSLYYQPYAMETPEVNAQDQYNAISPDFVVMGFTRDQYGNINYGVLTTIQASGLLILSVIAGFLILFVLLSITKGVVKINRSDFLGRENVSRNVKDFISRVEQLGGKVSVQNAESLTIRAFRTEGKIDRSADVEKRAKMYVENQKLLVTLQSRASRAYVAQKFKDCISAIEKMIQIARKLEDMTLVQNYEENLAKVVRLLRRKGISVSTKVRVEESAKPGEEIEQLSIYKKELIDLQNRASKAFAEKNFSEAKESIKQMLAIAKKIQDPVLIRNYEANLRKIIAMEKGGSV